MKHPGHLGLGLLSTGPRARVTAGRAAALFEAVDQGTEQPRLATRSG